MAKFFPFALVFLISHSISMAQNKALLIEGLKEVKISTKKGVLNKEEAILEGREILNQLYGAGYLSASIDSIVENDTQLKLIIHEGEQYKWIKLSKGNLRPEEEAKIDLRNKLFLQRPFQPDQLLELFENTIQYFENTGYPFASIKLDSIQFHPENGLSAALKVEKNKFYKVDSILVKGQSGINKTYLFQHLEIKPGDDYNQKKITEISTRIKEIPFVRELQKYEVQFFEEGIKIILHLERKNASRFDGILGLLTNEDDGTIELTGDVDLNLINSFKRGERIGFNWRKLKGNSQDLELKLIYPYFLNTPFGIDFNFKLFKRDTTFIDITSKIGINYTLRRGEVVTLFLENKTSSLLSRNTLISGSNNEIPSLGDVTINSFGLAYDMIRYDYRFNPTRGLGFSTSFSVGQKQLKKMASLEAESPGIYDGVKLNTTQYNGRIKANYFIPIANRSTVMIGNQSAIIYSENIYQNELLRIGGLKILRGFDEESINASAYSIFSLEYRFLLDRNSYFSLFSDAGYYENENVENKISDNPMGVGAGISFETNAGIFTFNYAVGKQFDNPIEFSAAKIHFGFVNFF